MGDPPGLSHLPAQHMEHHSARLTLACCRLHGALSGFGQHRPQRAAHMGHTQVSPHGALLLCATLSRWDVHIAAGRWEQGRHIGAQQAAQAGGPCMHGFVFACLTKEGLGN